MRKTYPLVILWFCNIKSFLVISWSVWANSAKQSRNLISVADIGKGHRGPETSLILGKKRRNHRRKKSQQGKQQKKAPSKLPQGLDPPLDLIYWLTYRPILHQYPTDTCLTLNWCLTNSWSTYLPWLMYWLCVSWHLANTRPIIIII